ncbi:MAG: MTAP family purine nucleoside phosphorylase [Chloroflexi bacterium]|nr:MTAP family purine nucleoside phosphorylase [Chloroflexota bacterium]
MHAIIAGTDIYHIPDVILDPRTIETRYGSVQLYVGRGEREHLVFLPRHGPTHTAPPHRVNYRANMKALAILGVKSALAAYAVGSINPDIPPRGLVALDDLLDFTSGRVSTFFDGGASGVAHTIMSPPYCPTLRNKMLALAPAFGLEIRPRGTYVCTNGPRFETPGEIRAYAKLGADVVGMTGAQEAALARELGIHFAAVGLSINWAAGIESTIQIVQEGMDRVRAALLSLFIATLETTDSFECPCEHSVLVTHPPQTD